MCRFQGYLGPPLTLSELLLAPSHSLVRQAREPRRQRPGALNADGFGVGWYDRARRLEPARYRSERPIWTDASFASFAGVVASDAVLAAVREASPLLPIAETNSHPFAAGRWLFTHNGAVDGFVGTPGARLRQALSDERLAAIEGSTDSEVLFGLVLDGLAAGASEVEAMADVVARVQSLTTGRLNLAITDGTGMVATVSGNSLSVLQGPASIVVASEPYDDDPAWVDIPDGSVVVATIDGFEVAPLDAPVRT